MLYNLTEGDIKKIQIDEGIVVLDLGESTQKVLGPTRGGAEATITPSIRGIEYDGRRGKTKGMQVKDGEDAVIKVASLCCSQESLALALPGCNNSNGVLEQGEFGIIPESAYRKNIAIITKTVDNKFKILKFSNPMHEGAFGFKAQSKAENEHNLEFTAHYEATSNEDKLWQIKDSDTNPIIQNNE